MELKDQILDLVNSIEWLNQSIADTQKRDSDVSASSSGSIELLKQLTLELEEKKRFLRSKKMQYNQRMLSKLVTEGIKDDETNGWWHNRY
jgi:hypothetical protein